MLEDSFYQILRIPDYFLGCVESFFATGTRRHGVSQSGLRILTAGITGITGIYWITMINMITGIYRIDFSGRLLII
jgi:hypothetical protein